MNKLLGGLVLAAFLLGSYWMLQAYGPGNGTQSESGTNPVGSPPMELPEGIEDIGSGGRLEIGDPAPPFEAETLDGELLRLDAVEQPILLNFWATWCPPCLVEMPDIQRAHEAYGDRVRFIGISLLEPAAEVQSFVEEHGYSWTFIVDEEFQLGMLYRIQPIPTSFFIDAEGIIRHVEYKLMDEEKIRAELAALLGMTDTDG